MQNVNNSQQATVYAGKFGERAYAIGDVHGCVDLLQSLLVKIEQHNARAEQKPAHIIYLGDLIDRGPASKQVLDLLCTRNNEPFQTHYIMGNHEEALLRGLSGEPNLLEPWLRHGGQATVESYGVARGLLYGRSDDELEHIIRSAIPGTHLDFLSTFVDSIRFGDVLFVHAGIRPGIPLEAQSPQDMKWIRKEFVESTDDYGCLIVHGHTIVENVEVNPNRICVDTGAYKSGHLTAICIDEQDHGFLQTGKSEYFMVKT